MFVSELLWNPVLLTLSSILWQRCDSFHPGQAKRPKRAPWGWWWAPEYLPAAHRPALWSSPGFRKFALSRNEAPNANLWWHRTIIYLIRGRIGADNQTQLVFLMPRSARQAFIFPFNLISYLTHWKTGRYNFIISRQGGFKQERPQVLTLSPALM